MKEPQDAGKYQTNIDGTVQGSVIGDHNKVELHFHNPQDKATSPSKPHRVWNIPYLHNDYFTGRDEILTELHTRFKANHATALSQRHAMSGLGGIGKTQTAVEYAYRYHEDYQAVLWTRAESHEALTSSFVEIAQLLELPEKNEQDQTIIVQAVKRWLQDNSGWLLILDNADEPAIVREFLPTKCDGHILLTTRAQALGGLAQRIEVDTFTPELGALFLLRRATVIAADGALELATSGDREIAVQISKELGELPLALDQAGAYIDEVQCSLSDYLSLYRTRRVEVLKERGGLTDDHPDSVATTWSLSFQRVEEKNAAAADLLRLCAFLAPDAIPEEIITAGAEHLGPVLQTVANDPIALNKAIAALGAYSLIRRDTTEKTLSIHRLVQAVLRDAMSEAQRQFWTTRAIQVIYALFPVDESGPWIQSQRIFPHVLICLAHRQHWDMTFFEARSLVLNMGNYLQNRGQYAEAEPFVLQALAITKKTLGNNHPDTATSLHNLAALYGDQAKFEQAKSLNLQAITIEKKVLGDGHPNTASSLHNLAILYRDQGKFEQAEPLFLQILAIRKKVLGDGHPRTVNSLNELSILYEYQGKFEQAETLSLQALTISKKVLGDDHPRTAQLLNDLAALYGDQGKYSEAEPLHQEALTIRRKMLGNDHPDTAHSLNNLAALYGDQGKYSEAESFHQEALTIRRKMLGDDHPDTANSLHNLASLYHNQSKYEQAEPLYKRALAILKQSLGSQHPHTQQARQNYADLLRAMGRNKEAKQLEEKQ